MSDNLLASEVRSCITLQRELAEALEVIADEFDKRQRRLDVSKLTFANTGIVGGVLTIVGLALAPVTFGASLGLTIAGAAVGVGSAMGNIGSLIADKIISKKSLKNAEIKLKEYADQTETIRRLLRELLEMLNEPEKVFFQKTIENSDLLSEEDKNILIKMLQLSVEVFSMPVSVTALSYSVASGINQVIETAITAYQLQHDSFEALTSLTGMAANAFGSTANAGRAIGTVADVGADAAATTGKAAAAATGKAGAASTGKAAAAATGKVAASGVKVVGIATAGVGLALDVGAIIYYSYKIHKNNPSALAEKIRSVCKRLRQNMAQYTAIATENDNLNRLL